MRTFNEKWSMEFTYDEWMIIARGVANSAMTGVYENWGWKPLKKAIDCVERILAELYGKGYNAENSGAISEVESVVSRLKFRYTNPALLDLN